MVLIGTGVTHALTLDGLDWCDRGNARVEMGKWNLFTRVTHALTLDGFDWCDRVYPLVEMEMESRNLFDRGYALVEMESRNLSDRGYTPDERETETCLPGLWLS